MLDGLASGRAQLVVGTHALVQEAVTFARLGLVVVDEQHRFGVMQRAVLKGKGWNPDVLVMTATPIPRTLALTLYGDLDVSVIRELPPGRTPIETRAIPQSRRDEAYALVRRELDAGRQAYIVYPLVEESSKVDVRAATEMADHLASEVFPEYRLALLHGRLRPEEKDRVMRAFAAGDVQVLVSTTVIEVGIDVPNATVMVVEHAERFGLAQLHQLQRPRRPGRAAVGACCFTRSRPGRPERHGFARSWRPPTGSSSRSGTSSCAGRAMSSAPGSRGCRRCALAIWCAIGGSWSRPAGSRTWRSIASPRARWWRRPGGAGPAGSAWRRSDEPEAGPMAARERGTRCA